MKNIVKFLTEAYFGLEDCIEEWAERWKIQKNEDFYSSNIDDRYVWDDDDPNSFDWKSIYKACKIKSTSPAFICHFDGDDESFTVIWFDKKSTKEVKMLDDLKKVCKEDWSCDFYEGNY